MAMYAMVQPSFNDLRRASLDFANAVRRRSSTPRVTDEGNTNGANRGFDNEEVQEYKDVFEYFDSKKTGFITAKNMATTLRSLKPQPDEYLVEEKQEEIIRDYGGQVNFQQYLDVLHNIIRKAKKKKRKRSCYTNLSEKQMGEIKDAFTMFDHDGDGTISASELKSVMMNIGVYSTDEDIKDMVKEVDEDESGELEFPEFVQLMTRKISGAEVSNELLEAFRYFDKDGDGTISASEIRSVMDALGEDLSDTDIEEMIAEADRKGLGGVTYEDFVKMISSQ